MSLLVEKSMDTISFTPTIFFLFPSSIADFSEQNRTCQQKLLEAISTNRFAPLEKQNGVDRKSRKELFINALMVIDSQSSSEAKPFPPTKKVRESVCSNLRSHNSIRNIIATSSKIPRTKIIYVVHISSYSPPISTSQTCPFLRFYYSVIQSEFLHCSFITVLEQYPR